MLKIQFSRNGEFGVLLIAITPKLILTLYGSTCLGSIFESTRTV